MSSNSSMIVWIRNTLVDDVALQERPHVDIYDSSNLAIDSWLLRIQGSLLIQALRVHSLKWTLAGYKFLGFTSYVGCLIRRTETHRLVLDGNPGPFSCTWLSQHMQFHNRCPMLHFQLLGAWKAHGLIVHTGEWKLPQGQRCFDGLT